MKAPLKIAVFFLALAMTAYVYAEGFQYESRGKRDPFVALIGSDRPTVTKLEDISSVDDVKLEGIAIDGKGRQIVILNGETLKENDKVGDVELKKIGKKSITILIGGKSYDIYLPGEEGGIKGGK
jgi:hypothetical protein